MKKQPQKNYKRLVYFIAITAVSITILQGYANHVSLLSIAKRSFLAVIIFLGIGVVGVKILKKVLLPNQRSTSVLSNHVTKDSRKETYPETEDASLNSADK